MAMQTQQLQSQSDNHNNPTFLFSPSFRCPKHADA